MAHTTDTGRLGHAFDRLLHARLPLPLARLYARGSNAVSARNRLLSAYFLHEATLKLAVSIDIMRVLQRPWHDAQLDRYLEMLAMPSVGVFSALLPKLAEEDFEGKGPAFVLCQKTKETPAVGGAVEVMSFGKERRRSLASPADLYAHLPIFRNRLITGDEVPEPSECASMAEVLLDAFAQIASATSILDHLSLGVVDSRSEISNNMMQIKSFDLTGPTPVRTKAEKMPADDAFQPGRPFAKTPEGTWLPLHPLVHFREDEFLPELLFVGGIDPERGVLYLDYVTGRSEDADVDLEPGRLSPGDAELLQLIARARKKPMKAAEFRELARESAKKYPTTGRTDSDKSKTFGEYRLLGELGRGGMGIVYLARQETVGRFVALKLFPPALAQDSVASARFEREIAALGRCDHPNVVKVIAAGKAERTSYYAMELVSGTTLAGLVDSLPETHSLAEAISVAAAKDRESFEGLPDLPKVSTPSPSSLRPSSRRNALREIADMMAQAAQGVHHLHEHGILHRDLKPANLMVSAEDQRVVVMDLGLAAVEGTSVTQDQDAVLGTLRYMAPEQLIRSATEVDRRSDIYSLGATLYELVTSKPVHDGDSQPRIIQQVLHEDPKRASAVADDIPPDLDAILLRCLSKKPGDRYPTAIDLANDLESFARGEPVSARVPTAGEQVWRLVVKYRTYLGLIAAAIVALISLAVVSFVKISKERRDVLRLSDLESLEKLQRSEKNLWPAFPSLVPEMRAWLEEAEVLTSRIDLHRSRLEALQGRSTHDSMEGDTATAAIKESLEEEREKIRISVKAAEETKDRDALLDLSLKLREIDEALAGIERAGGARTIDFVSDQDQWWHDTLEDLVSELVEFRDTTMTSVEQRIEEASKLAALLEQYADSWEQAIANIEASDHYGGLRIQPQLGLIPIGRDPATGFEEFAHPQSGTIPQRDEEGHLIIGEGSAIVFILLPGGSFVMGAEKSPRGTTDAEPERIPGVRVRFDPNADALDEEPCHSIDLDPFFISKYEVSQAQWTRLTGSNPSRYSLERKVGGILITPLHPVESVSWVTANSVLERLGLRLPTEAQWEYSARGGTDTIWWTGDDRESLEGVCNIADRTLRRSGIVSGIEYDSWLDDGYVLHAPIGSFAPNPFGLHDTIGNVWEWCLDSWGLYHLPTRPGDGERLAFDTENRANRSGHYLRDATYSRSSNRDFQLLTSSHGGLGVRPARTIEGLRDEE